MDYELKVYDDLKTLDVAVISEKEFSVVIDEEKSTVTAVPVSPHLMHVKIDGRSAMRTYFARTQNGVWIWIDGKARFVQDADTLAARRSSAGLDGHGATEVTPPMPATVIKILTEAGAHVAKGEALVVVSAMKMETTLTAPFDGTVESVNTEVGANVSPGDILVDIRADESEKEGNDE